MHSIFSTSSYLLPCFSWYFAITSLAAAPNYLSFTDPAVLYSAAAELGAASMTRAATTTFIWVNKCHWNHVSCDETSWSGKCLKNLVHCICICHNVVPIGALLKGRLGRIVLIRNGQCLASVALPYLFPAQNHYLEKPCFPMNISRESLVLYL